MIITIECSSIANYSSFDMEMTSLSPLNNGKISTDFLGFKLSYHGKNNYVFQVGLEGQLCEEVYPRSVYFLNMFIILSKSILIIPEILLLIFVHDFGILKQLFFILCSQLRCVLALPELLRILRRQVIIILNTFLN